MFRKPLFKNSPQREEDDSSSSSSTTTPKKGKNKQNPYAVGGRDKFATILADLDRKRRTIYEQVGTQDISKVRFGYCDSRKWVPIVVRSSKDHPNDDKAKSVAGKDKHVTHNTQKVEKEVNQPREDVDGKTEKQSLYGRVNSLCKYIQPSGDFPIVFILVLCCLGVYGRVFAVICTCIWCFLVFRVKIGEVNSKELVKRRDYERLGEKKMESDVNTVDKKTKISEVSASPKREILSQGLNARMSSPKTNPTNGLLPKVSASKSNLTPGLLPKTSAPKTNLAPGLVPKMTSAPKTNLHALSPKASPNREIVNLPKSPVIDYLTPPLSPKKGYFGRAPSPKRDYLSPPLTPARDYLGPPLTPKRSYFSPALSPKRESVVSSSTSPMKTPTPGLSPRHIRVYNKSW